MRLSVGHQPVIATHVSRFVCVATLVLAILAGTGRETFAAPFVFRDNFWNW